MPQVSFPRLTKVVRRLLIANGVVFLLTFALSFGTWSWFDELFKRLALAPSDWRSPLVPIWQLFTYGFLHSIDDIGHVLMNMLTLYFFGTMLEEMIGGRRFLLTYFAAQVTGAFLFLLAGWITGSPKVAIGASGAVYGIMIVMAVLRPRQTVFLMFIPVTLKVLAFVILGITLFAWLSSLKGGGGDGVAHLVHLGGIAYGFAAARLGWIYKDPLDAIDRRRAVAIGCSRRSTARAWPPSRARSASS
jgi:membrane associated rhomboid family serine protease